MPLENATYISDLNGSNPVGSTDKVQTLDDHIRLIKTTLKTTFPSVTGAVTASHSELNTLDGITASVTELNYLDGVTGVTGTGNLALSASPTFTGTVGAAAITASGTITGNLFSGSGASLTGLPAANITGSHTLPDGVLSTNVPLLSAGASFAGSLVSSTGSLQSSDQASGDALLGLNTIGQQNWTIGIDRSVGAGLVFAPTSDLSGAVMTLSTGGVLTINGVANSDYARKSAANTFTANQIIDVGGGLIQTTNAAGFASLQIRADGGSHGWMAFTEDGVADRWVIGIEDGDGTLYFATGQPSSYAKKLGLNSSGEVTSRPNASAAEVGCVGAPSRDITASTNTAASDAGKTIRMTSGSGQTFTLDSDPPEDTVVILDNASGNAWTIAASSSLVWAATGGTGSRTLANGGLAVALHQGAGVWKISGGGLT